MPTTINELERYLEENGFSFTELSIGSHYAPEGIVIEETYGSYNFCYSERGKKEVVKSFDKESDLVQFSLNQLISDEWSMAHIVAATFNKSEIMEAENFLNQMNISFKRNDVPNFKMGQTAYRIFVFGTDINKLDNFKNRYFHY